MKKFGKIGFSFILFVIMFSFSDVLAMTKEEIASRNACVEENMAYELALAKDDGSLEKRACFPDYYQAKTAMDESEEVDLVILERVNDYTSLIDAKYALMDLNRGNVVTYYYADEKDETRPSNYMNNSSSYGGVDGAFIKVNFPNKVANLKVAGYTGWINPGDYEIVPLPWVRSKSFYVIGNGNSDDNIWHCYAKDIQNELANPTCRNFGRKPEHIDPGTYYSYDGIYFYSDLVTMLNDYKANTFEHAVNVEHPYYNYYLFLPHHSKTTYSSNNIDEYFRSIFSEHFVGTPYANQAKYGYSKLYGQGAFFYNAQQIYGANAIMMLGLSQNESGNGKSNIVINNNNGFGHNAVDSDPAGSADGYATFANGIYTHAYKWITYGYSYPFDSRFLGGIFGHKAIGMNIKYASDPFWAEKAASFYYDFDLANGLYDYNYYQLAVTNRDYVPVRIDPKNNAREVYSYKAKNISMIILEEVQGDAVEGNTAWYKIMSDVNLDSNRNSIYPNDSRPYYQWENSYVYVPASYVSKINQAKDGLKTPNEVYAYQDKDYQYDIYTENGVQAPKVAIALKNASLYYDSTLQTKRGITVAKDTYLMVFVEVKDKEGKTIAYQVTSDYNKNQVEWISASDIKIVEKDFGKLIVDQKGVGSLLYESPSEESRSVGLVYTKTYLPILGIKEVEGRTWLKVQNGITNNSTGWILAVDDGAHMDYSIEHPNTPPVIEAKNQEIALGSKYDPLLGVRAHDNEDGDLTSKLKVLQNKVDTSKAGVYTVIYTVSDSEGKTTMLSIKITVKGYTIKDGLFYFQSLTHKSNDEFEVSGFFGITGMDNTLEQDIKHVLILKNVDTNTEYRFDVTRWKSGYPFEMSNVDDDKPYQYNGGWFKGVVNLGSVPEGDYIAEIEVTNGIYQARAMFNNLAFQEMTRRSSTSKGRGYYIEMNYYEKKTPLHISIRDKGLIATSIPSTVDLMFNYVEKINFLGNFLHLKGTSHNVGIDYGKDKTVNRQIIFENVSTYERYTYSLGSTVNGDYPIDLAAPDGLDKTRGWFDQYINVSNIPQGTYAIYIRTGVGNFADYGELQDIAFLDMSAKTTMNGKEYSIRRVEDKRFRIELVIK